MKKDYIQVDESTLPVIDNEKHRAVKGYMWAVRDAVDEDRKHASEAIVYISKLYKLETEMKEAGLDPDAVRERREKEAYPIIQDFEKWMNAVANRFTPKSRMGKAIVYTE